MSLPTLQERRGTSVRKPQAAYLDEGHCQPPVNPPCYEFVFVGAGRAAPVRLKGHATLDLDAPLVERLV
jgi:hypothetical protein